MKLRNWIERKTGKRWAWYPVKIGCKGGRDVYSIDWEDGTTQDYYIDFEAEEIEEVYPGLVRSSSYPYEIISNVKPGA